MRLGRRFGNSAAGAASRFLTSTLMLFLNRQRHELVVSSLGQAKRPGSDGPPSINDVSHTAVSFGFNEMQARETSAPAARKSPGYSKAFGRPDTLAAYTRTSCWECLVSAVSR